MRKRYLYLISITLTYLSCFIQLGYSQVVTQFTSNLDNNLSLQSVWGFQLNNLSPDELTGFIEVKISNSQTEPLVVIQTPRFSILSGVTSLNNDIIKNSKIEYNKSNSAVSVFKKEGVFPRGLYYICVTIRDSKSEAELGQNCTQSNITFEAQSDTTIRQKGQKENFFTKNVGFSGYSEITGVYSNMQALNSNMPPSYLQWYLNPTITLFDFPISAQMFLSTRQSDNQQNINTFNIQFDANQFMNILKQRATDFIKKKINNDKINNLTLESFTSDLNSVKSKLENPGALQELAQIKQLDSLKGSLSNFENMKLDSSMILDNIQKLKKIAGKDSTKMDTAWYRNKLDSLNIQRDSLMNSKIDSLKNKIKVLKWLEDKKPYYDKLMKQKDEFEKKLNGFSLDSLNNKLDDFQSKYDPQKLNDPKFLYSFLGKFKLFKKFEKLMTSVKKFAIGTSYPTYSDFTFKGVPVNGINIELEKFNTSIGFIYGDVQQGIMSNGNLMPHFNFAYKRTVVGGSIGYGSRDKSHIHFTLLNFQDDPTSIVVPDSLVNLAPKPQSNQVMSVDFRVQLLKKTLSFYGELAGSQTIRDITLIDSSFIINTSNPNNPREWFSNIFLQKDVDLNTSVDFAFRAGAEVTLFKGITKISTQVKRVGPSFLSMGNPFMIRDLFNIEAKVSQSFWKKRIVLSGFLRRNIDNLENTKLLTSQLYNFGFDFSLNIPKWPTLKVSMTPYVQSNDSSHMNINVISANTNYICKIRKIQLMTNLSYMHQSAIAADSSMNFRTHYITLLNTLLLSKSVSLNVTQSYFQINNRYGDIGTYSLNMSGSILAFKKWNSTIGATITTNQNERRYGGYYQTSLQFLKIFTVNLRVEYSRNDIINYTAYNNGIPFDQVTVRGMIITRW